MAPVLAKKSVHKKSPMSKEVKLHTLEKAKTSSVKRKQSNLDEGLKPSKKSKTDIGKSKVDTSAHPREESSPDSRKASLSKPKAAKSNASVAKAKLSKARSPSTEPEEEDGSLPDFSSDEEDSSDEEIDDQTSAFDVENLPTVAKDDAVVKQKLDKIKKKPQSERRGVVYLGRLPHGFYEGQIKAYFSQFGDVTRLRVSRNRKTGRSKHYAFVEFASEEVAQIVSETMDNYLIAGHLLHCKLIPKDEVNPNLWIGANRKFRVIPVGRVVREAHNRPRTAKEQDKAYKRLQKRQQDQMQKIKASGINYDFDFNGSHTSLAVT